MSRIVISLLSLSLLCLTGCSSSYHTESAGEYLDSSATTTKVKASLIDELGSHGFSIKVKTYKDEVQLSGFVDTLRIKQKAGVIALGVPGVKSVSNDIVVKSR
ncbi:MAG: transporter [Legionella sp.]|nr:MAG: transporter [Legionella sp.]PJD99525.1 MAG: transporter [Legionella sp.]